MAAATPTRFAARLPSRGLVQVSGADSLRFLQSLVTNDVHQICSPAAQSTSLSAFLNPRGRVLFGALMHRSGDARYLLDTTSARVPALLSHLKQYRLRAKVEIDDVTDTHAVWSVTGARDEDRVDAQVSGHGVVFEDPRLSSLGLRAIVSASFPGFDALPPAQESAYDRLRILHGVPDGPDFDNTPLPLDLAMHLLNGISFEKGCYLGQELTARSHFTGVLRKRITPVAVIGEEADSTDGDVSDNPDLALAPGTEVFVEGKAKRAGVITSASGNVGLAVLRLSDAFSSGGWGSAAMRLSDGREARAQAPGWWPAKELR